MEVRERLCLGCGQTKPLLDGMFLCDECREKIALQVSPTGQFGGDSEKPKLLSYLVKTSFFDTQPEEKSDGIDNNRISVFVKAFLETLSIEQVCEEFSVSTTVVNNAFQKANVRLWMHDMQIIIRGEYAAGATKEELAGKYELSEKAINTILQKDFRVRMPRDLDRRRCIEMRHLYFNEHMAQDNIAKVYDCAPIKVMSVCGQDWLDDEK